MASIEKGIYVTTGSIEGTSVRCKSQLKYIPAKEAKELEAFFSEHLLNENTVLLVGGNCLVK